MPPRHSSANLGKGTLWADASITQQALKQDAQANVTAQSIPVPRLGEEQSSSAMEQLVLIGMGSGLFSTFGVWRLLV